MTDGSDRWQELDGVLDRVLDGIYDEQDLRRLNEILRADVEACRHYIHYVELHGRLAWGETVSTKGEREEGDDMPSASVPAAAIVIQTSPELPTTYSPVGGFLFSYAVAAATVAIGLLVGWMYQISVSQQPISQQTSRGAAPSMIAQTPNVQLVGQITGVFDCQWAAASTPAIDRAYVPLGRRYALASGLMEITYDSGAKVILQGPCIYQVESKISGYLGLGTLTAKVQKSGEGRAERAERREASQDSTINNHKSSSPLFSVRTPTAIVTDLGTEFAVEVDKSGASRAHVFVGKVEVRAADGGNTTAASLGPNESARVDFGKDRVAVVVRESGRRRPFVREMPKSLPIVLFNTGVGLKKGDLDPHWQVVARSDDPKFKPRPAVVRGLRDGIFLKDDPDRSQWLSLAVGDVEFPQDVVYVFRTTFDLTGMLASKAVLRGKFLADDRLVGIRLNGRRLPVPLHRDGSPFLEWTSFQTCAGFVKGTNVLEFDVLNSDPHQSPSQRRTAKSRMSFRAELEGVAASDPAFVGDKAVGAVPRKALQKGKAAATEAKKTGAGEIRAGKKMRFGDAT